MAKISKSIQTMEAICDGVALKGAEDKKVGKSINRVVYKIPPQMVEVLEKNNIKFSSYAIMAVREKLIRDGYVSNL